MGTCRVRLRDLLLIRAMLCILAQKSPHKTWVFLVSGMMQTTRTW